MTEDERTVSSLFEAVTMIAEVLEQRIGPPPEPDHWEEAERLILHELRVGRFIASGFPAMPEDSPTKQTASREDMPAGLWELASFDPSGYLSGARHLTSHHGSDPEEREGVNPFPGMFYGQFSTRRKNGPSWYGVAVPAAVFRVWLIALQERLAAGSSDPANDNDTPDSPAPSSRESTIRAEKDCQRWLEAEMRGSLDDSPKPRDAFQAEAMEKFSVSGRAFGRAWGQALAQTGARWSEGGRPKKNPRT